jgi:hypothetical protein
MISCVQHHIMKALITFSGPEDTLSFSGFFFQGIIIGKKVLMVNNEVI